MIECRGGARFLLKAPQSIFVPGKGRGQDLDGHISAERCVAGPVDFAHSAGTNPLHDAVVPKRLANNRGGTRHRRGC